MTTQIVQPEMDEAVKEALTQQGRDFLDKLHSQITDADKHLLAAGEGPWMCPGPWEISAIPFKKIEVKCELLYPPGETQGWVKFHATEARGLAVMHGFGMGIATMARKRRDIVGEVEFEAHAIGVGPSVMQINWWRDDGVIGTFFGGGLLEGGGAVWGKGRFELA